MKLQHAITLVFTTMACAFPIRAQTPNFATTGAKTEMVALESEPGLKAFLDEYFAACNNKDLKKVEAMHHPKDWQAVTNFVAHKPAAFNRLTLENMVCKGGLPKKHGPYVVKRILPGSPPPQDGFVDWPVPPEMEVHCSYEYYENGIDNVGVWISYLVREDGKWFVVNGVPGPKMLRGVQKPSATPAAAQPSSTFGPVVERKIRGGGTNLWALNLASGNVVAQSTRQSFKSADDEASLRAAGADLYQSVWANTPTAIKTLDMRLCAGVFPQAGATNPITLDNLTVEQLRQALATMENWRADMETVSLPGFDLRRATSNIAGTNLHLFITRDGVKGALQISLGETSPAVLRYRLMQNSPAPTK